MLTEDPAGVLSENRKRRIQSLGDSFGATFNPDWLAELGLDEASTPTTHYFSTGVTPVVVTGPAIIVQPNGGEADGK